MGKVKGTYIQYAAAVDQHVGRVVSGLPVLNVKYACTPPYFCIDPMDHNNASNEEAQNVCQLDDVNTVNGALFLCKSQLCSDQLQFHVRLPSYLQKISSTGNN